MTQTRITQCIDDYFAALCNKDVEAWLAAFAADGASHDPVGAPPNVGHAALRQYFGTLAALFERVAIAAEQVVVCDSRAAAKWQAECVGMNGRTVRFAGLDVFEMDANGNIKALWGFWDPAAMFAELNG
jgi:steroid delta-isomerase